MIQRTIPCVLLLTTLTACKTPPKEAEVDANGKKIEYVWITPTGSHLPVKVRKDQAQTSDAQTASDQQALSRLLQTSSRPDKQAGGP